MSAKKLRKIEIKKVCESRNSDDFSSRARVNIKSNFFLINCILSFHLILYIFCCAPYIAIIIILASIVIVISMIIIVYFTIVYF